MANAPYTIGRNGSVVILWQGTRYDFRDITSFSSAQETRTQRSDPLNGLPVEFNTPGGWRGTIQLDRGSSAVDDLIAAIENAFWSAGTIGSGTIYHYIQETDGSTSTFEYVQVSLTLTNAGSYAAEGIVRQTLSFYASQRNSI